MEFRLELYMSLIRKKMQLKLDGISDWPQVIVSQRTMNVA